MSLEQLATLRAIASKTAELSFVPFSGRNEAVVLLLSNGQWIPGVRVESATFSLLISPLLNALTTAVALDRTDIVAAVMSRALHPSERTYASLAPFLYDLAPRTTDTLMCADCRLPRIAEQLSPLVSSVSDLDVEAEISLARNVAKRAHVPESDFPVGCIVRTRDAAYVPGVNVEHPDWNHILCAERNAIGTCVSFGLLEEMSSIILTCLKDPGATPCGACRQLLVELAPTATLWMDRGEHPPAQSDPITLLPGSFTGERIASKT